MASLRICKYGQSILRRKCQKIEDINAKILKVLDNMSQTMYENEGIGLAAPQIGLDKQLIVVNAGDGLWKLINPKIISQRGKSLSLEGCLSLPGISVKVKRAKEATVEALNSKGEKIIIEAKNLFSAVLQHEIDHLNGILIIDYLDKKSKKKAEEQLKKWLKEARRM